MCDGSDIRVVLDMPYARNDDPKNRLDLYLPDGPNFPVVVFAHGGAWVSGDKAQYSHLGVLLARHGIGAVLINYRLCPQVRHPAPVEDFAKAFAWTHDHLNAYGGNPDRLFLCGHSAGGHLASLLATDERFLGAEDLSLKHVRGVISVSGVYIIHWNVSIYGAGRVFQNVDRRTASPFWNVKPGCPPFLTLYAEKDYWTLAGQARKFHEKLRHHNCPSRLAVAEGENHISIIKNLVLPSSRYGQDILRFIHGE